MKRIKALGQASFVLVVAFVPGLAAAIWLGVMVRAFVWAAGI